MDAVRISDGKHLMLKWISKKIHPFEVEIGQFFSSQPLANDPRNHCIPLLDVLQDPEDDDRQIIVMPRMIEISRPVFETVGEVIDCFQQIFEVSLSQTFAVLMGKPLCSFKGRSIHARALCGTPVCALMAE